MKIRVTTEEYSYMGLYYGQEFDEEVTLIQSAKAWDHVRFVNRGKVWILRPDQYEVVSGSNTKDMVNSPSHYALFDDIEAIQVIASSMTKEMFKGYCFGNLLKYKLRAGGKDDIQQELKKADKYKELYEKYQNLCKQN